MIKKIIILTLLAAAVYVGYRVWGNLSQTEKASVSKRFDKTLDGAKKLLDKTADNLTDTAKDAISDMDKKSKTADKKTDKNEPDTSPEKPNVQPKPSAD